MSSLQMDRFKYQSTMNFAVPPNQVIRAGWKLLWLGLWWSIRRKDMWISAGFEEKRQDEQPTRNIQT